MSIMSSTKVVTGKVRFSYLNAFVPKAIGDSPDLKYSVSLIISKKDTKTLDAIKAAIKAAAEAGKTAKFGGKIPNPLKTPLRDGDVERPEDPNYKNSYFINANAKTKPGLIDAERDEILDSAELYSGCYGRASVTFYPFNTQGNKGIAAGLNHLQKLADGDHLDGRTNPEDDFGDDFDADSIL